MRIDVNYALERLSTLQIESGGYYGTDITKLSKELGVTPRGLRKQITKWKRSVKEFRDMRYLGQRPPSVTLDEFIEIEARMHSNPIEVKRHILEDIRADRFGKGLQNLPSSTFYQAMKQTDLYQFLSATKYSWFKVRGIDIPGDYSVSDERNTLSTSFTFSNLKAYSGADLEEIFNRLTKTRKYTKKYGVAPAEFYPQILNRGSLLRSLLSSIPQHQQEEIQARIIFETQLAYVVECTDLFVNEVIHRKGRIQQSMNARRQKVENQIRKEELESIRNTNRDMVLAHKPDMDTIHKIAYPVIDEKIRARFKLLRANKNTYEFLIGLLQEFTKDGSNEFYFHLDEGKRFFDLACGETNWQCWGPPPPPPKPVRGFLWDCPIPSWQRDIILSAFRRQTCPRSSSSQRAPRTTRSWEFVTRLFRSRGSSSIPSHSSPWMVRECFAISWTCALPDSLNRACPHE